MCKERKGNFCSTYSDTNLSFESFPEERKLRSTCSQEGCRAFLDTKKTEYDLALQSSARRLRKELLKVDETIGHCELTSDLGNKNSASTDYKGTRSASNSNSQNTANLYGKDCQVADRLNVYNVNDHILSGEVTHVCSVPEPVLKRELAKSVPSSVLYQRRRFTGNVMSQPQYINGQKFFTSALHGHDVNKTLNPGIIKKNVTKLLEEMNEERSTEKEEETEIQDIGNVSKESFETNIANLISKPCRKRKEIENMEKEQAKTSGIEPKLLLTRQPSHVFRVPEPTLKRELAKSVPCSVVNARRRIIRNVKNEAEYCRTNRFFRTDDLTNLALVSKIRVALHDNGVMDTLDPGFKRENKRSWPPKVSIFLDDVTKLLEKMNKEISSEQEERTEIQDMERGSDALFGANSANLTAESYVEKKKCMPRAIPKAPLKRELAKSVPCSVVNARRRINGHEMIEPDSFLRKRFFRTDDFNFALVSKKRISLDEKDVNKNFNEVVDPENKKNKPHKVSIYVDDVTNMLDEMNEEISSEEEETTEREDKKSELQRFMRSKSTEGAHETPPVLKKESFLRSPVNAVMKEIPPQTFEYPSSASSSSSAFDHTSYPPFPVQEPSGIFALQSKQRQFFDDSDGDGRSTRAQTVFRDK